MGVAESQITCDKRRIMEQNLWMVDEINEQQVAVNIALAADTACARLFRKGKEKEAFEVRVKAIDVLQSLGYLKRTPIEFTGQIGLQEIIKLANSPDTENETFLSERTGRGRKNFIENGAS